MLGKGYRKNGMRTRAKDKARAEVHQSRADAVSTSDPPIAKRSRMDGKPEDGNGPAILPAAVSTQSETKEILATVPRRAYTAGGFQAEHNEYPDRSETKEILATVPRRAYTAGGFPAGHNEYPHKITEKNAITKGAETLEEIYEQWVDKMSYDYVFLSNMSFDTRKGAFINYMNSNQPNLLETVALDAGITHDELMEGFIFKDWQDYMSYFNDIGDGSASQHSDNENPDIPMNNENYDLTISNAVQVLNDMYDTWLNDNSRSSTADTSIKAFIAHCHCSDPALFVNLSTNANIDCDALIDAFENGTVLDETVATNVVRADSAVNVTDTAEKKKRGRPAGTNTKRSKNSVNLKKTKVQANNWRDKYYSKETPEQAEKRCSKNKDRQVNLRNNAIPEQRVTQNAEKRIKRQNKKNQAPAEYVRDLNTVELFRLGTFDFPCKHCGALYFAREGSLLEQSKAKNNREYNVCCALGKIKMPDSEEYPPILKSLFTKEHFFSKTFYEHIRQLNSSFSFASVNAHVKSLPGQYHYRIQGSLYHLFNHASHPIPGEPRSYAQMFFLDTQEASTLRSQNPCNVGIDYDLFYEIENELKQIGNSLREAYKMMWQIEQEQAEEAQSLNKPQKRVTLVFSREETRDRNDLPPTDSNEVAAVYVTNAEGDVPHSYVTVYDKEGYVSKFSTLSEYLDPFTYPLFFPHGETGWRDHMPYQNKKKIRSDISRREFIRYKLAFRPLDNPDSMFNPIHFGGKLLHQFGTDCWTRIEGDVLAYHKLLNKNMKTYKSSALTNPNSNDATETNETNDAAKRQILNSKYVGSIRYYQLEFQKSMIQARRFGPPDFFITITFSPDNEDLKNALNIALPEDKFVQQAPNFRPDLVARAFEIIYKDFINLMSKTPEEIGFGEMVCYSAVNEWQMRGNPHGHTIWTLDKKDKIKTTEQLDKIIWAHIPDSQIYPELYALVAKFMIHGPCNQTSACWKNGKCSKHFPYQFCEKTTFNEEGGGKPKYARPNDGRYVEKRDMHSKKWVKLDNRYVVPYNPELLLRYRSHINVEHISSVLLFKYIHKYVQKGPSKAKVNVVEEKEEIDEIKDHLDVRVVSAQESFHRIFGFPLNRRSHGVIELKIHLEGQNKVYYMGKETAEQMVEKANQDSELTGFMKLCRESIHANFAQDLYFWQLPEHFSWKNNEWNATKIGTDVLKNGKVWMIPDGSGKWYKKSENLGMMYDVSPAQTELFHLRILLLHVKGPTSFEYLRTVDEIVYQTYQQACIKRGLTTDDQEWHRCLNDAKDRFMPRRMRILFVNILLHCNPCIPLELWETFKDPLSEDYTHMLQVSLANRAGVNPEEYDPLSQDVQQLAYDKAYAEIAYLYFEEKGQEITVLLNMPEPNMELNDLMLNLNAVSHAQIAEAMFESMKNNEEQKKFFLMLREEAASITPRQSYFYLEGQAGTGKTFTYTAIFHDLMSKGKLVKTMASTGIAATLLPHGRTVHYTAGIYPPVHSKSITHLTKNSKKGKDLIEATLLIWDEAPMADRFLLEALDRSLQYLCDNKNPFGGKLMILGGDFRQCAPVVPEGSKSQIVGQSIKRSELWPLFSPPFVLTKNQRVNPDEIEFMDTLKTLGSGELQKGDEGYFDFPKACLSDDVITEVFGDCLHNKNYEAMHDRVVLTPYNREADQINNTILDLLEGEEKIYTSVDTLSRDNNLQVTEHYSTEILNSTDLNNFPKHELRLKVHAIIMLIINLNASQALCNGTRLQITELKDNVIQGKHISGENKGEIVYIPRTDKMSDDKKLPFKFNRHQFPVRLAFAMTINKSQGQTFSYVGLYLLNDVFTHGQLYVAASRVRKVMDLKIQLDLLREHDSVKNVVYKELLLN